MSRPTTHASPAASAALEPAAHAAYPDADRKAFATLQARAALAGWTLASFTEPCGYSLCRWGMARMLPDLAAVVAFLRQVGVPE